jgi:hypothetical protein
MREHLLKCTAKEEPVIAANVSEKTFIGKEELEKNQEQY